MGKSMITKRMRSAVSTVSMVLVTAIAFVLYNHNLKFWGVSAEVSAGVVYAIWVMLGPDSNEDEEDE